MLRRVHMGAIAGSATALAATVVATVATVATAQSSAPPRAPAHRMGAPSGGSGSGPTHREGVTGAAPASAPPTLVVYLTVDQMRADYFERFLPQLTGGLGRLYHGGAVFTHGVQDHAVTETAPGHATTLSGREPWKTGIVANAQGVLDAQSPLVGTTGDPASPYRFRGSTLIDWMRTSDPRSRALSVSRKDRAAILPIGRAHQLAIWYAATGIFTTSHYYADTLPGWLTAFNALRRPASFTGRSWTPLLPESAYPEPDSVVAENGGRDIVFPHRLPTDTAAALRALSRFPQMDEVTLEAALAGVRALDLGGGPQPDLLAISLSTTDAVGHAFGPDSRELHDQILQLDRFLGAFLDTLYSLRDSSRVVVALTADHGVAPYPEVHTGRDANARATHVDIAGLVELVAQALPRRGIDRSAWRWENGMLWVDHDALASGGLDPDSVVRSFTAGMRRVPGVARVDSYRSLASRDTTHDAIARRWLHMFPADLAPDLVVTLTPYSVWGNGASAEHGSPYDYDARVPIIFAGAPFRAGTYAAVARVTDMAPTIAAVLHVAPTEPLDGRVLHEALRADVRARVDRAGQGTVRRAAAGR